MRAHLGVGLLVVALAAAGACKRKAAAEQADGAAASEAPVDFDGRCVNESPGVVYQSIFFFPKHREMFFYTGMDGALRSPITVTKQAPRRVDFTYRSAEDGKLPETHVGHVTADGDKWQFEFDTFKNSTCQPAPAADFYKMLPDLGITAGKWEDKTEHVSIVVAADAQAWGVLSKGTTLMAYYRVFEQTGNSILVTSHGPQVPSDSDSEGWSVLRLTHAADTLVSETKDVTLHYKLVAAAPKLQ